ncbi:MAG TPA: heavy metal translocating P-type ATPase [Paenalcaligenes sp.]|nr:heavy metal translocating P-type ATPase [Paenalcaligenes sp.]
MDTKTSNAVQLSVQGMNCAACVRHVERALTELAGVKLASVNLATAKAYVELEPTHPAAVTDMIAAIDKKGFHATEITADNKEEVFAATQTALHDEAETKKKNFFIALILSLPVFITDMGAHLIPGFGDWLHSFITARSLAYFQFVLTTLVILFPGWSFFSLGFRALAQRAPDMNTLVAIGAGSAWLYSTFATVAPQLLPEGAAHLYFEAAAVVITLILLGKYFEARAKGQTGAAIQELLSLQSASARIYRDGNWQILPIDQLRIDDEILVQPGETVAADGVVIDGVGHINEMMITGESMPVRKEIGDEVIGGTLNGSSSIRVKVTHLPQESVLANIIRLVENAQENKLPVQALVDKITLWFVPVVLAIAAASFIYWAFISSQGGLSIAVVNAVAVLIVACPCAMGLATPTSIMVGTGRAAKTGVLFRQGQALQQLAQVKNVAFDKTGTLTIGEPTLSHLELADGLNKEDVLSDLAAVQSHSEHPIALAIVAAAKERNLRWDEPSAFQALTGLGVEAKVNNHHYLLGSADLMAAQQIDTDRFTERFNAWAKQGQTPVYIARDQKLIGVLTINDPIREEAKEVIKWLTDNHIKSTMITGDHPLTAQYVADRLGISGVYAQTKPDDKASIVKMLQAQDGLTAFVGDGINDAPALAQSDIGIAIGGGTDVAIESADVVLLGAKLSHIFTGIQLARLTLRNIKQNLFWAFAYNVALIPLAAGALFYFSGHLFSPIYSAIAMALSSVFVVSNALRLRYIRLR